MIYELGEYQPLFMNRINNSRLELTYQSHRSLKGVCRKTNFDFVS